MKIFARSTTLVLCGVVIALVGCNKRLRLVDKDEPSASATAPGFGSPAAPGENASGGHPLAPATTEGNGAAPAVPGATTTAPTATTTTTAAAAKKKYPPTCAGACEYTLRCMGAFNAQEQASCVTECTRKGEDPNKLSQVNATDCATLVAQLRGGGKPNPPNNGGNNGGNTGACSRNDCLGCYWEQDMCMYVHGYIATGIKQACKACCCPGH